MSFDKLDLYTMYTSVTLMRENCEAELDELPLSDPERNLVLDNLKQCNSTLRKLKAFMVDNGVEIPDF